MQCSGTNSMYLVSGNSNNFITSKDIFAKNSFSTKTDNTHC